MPRLHRVDSICRPHCAYLTPLIGALCCNLFPPCLHILVQGKTLLAQPMLFVKIFFCKDEIQECRGVHKTCCRFEQSQIQIGSERPTDGPRVPMMWTDRVNWRDCWEILLQRKNYMLCTNKLHIAESWDFQCSLAGEKGSWQQDCRCCRGSERALGSSSLVKSCEGDCNSGSAAKEKLFGTDALPFLTACKF